MAVRSDIDTASVRDHDEDIMTASRRRRGSSITSTGSLREQYLALDQDVLRPSPEATQLPSPLPSLRGTSPSLASTEYSVEWEETPEDRHGDSYSPSFEHARIIPTIEMPSSESKIGSPKPISKMLPPHELHDISEERPRKPRKLSSSKTTAEDKVLKLSPSEMEELASTPESLPLPLGANSNGVASSSPTFRSKIEASMDGQLTTDASRSDRPNSVSRTTSTPSIGLREPSRNNPGSRQLSPRRSHANSSSRMEIADLNGSIKSSSIKSGQRSTSSSDPQPLRTPRQDVPLPPLLSSYLQLELASSRP